MLNNISAQDLLEAVKESEKGTANPGFCIACGERQEGVEPDARGYLCECCGERRVYGVLVLLLLM